MHVTAAAAFSAALLEEYNIEIAGGMGEYADRMWRVGIMGYSAQRRNVMLLLTALEQTLRRHGFDPSASAPAAADSVYSR